VLLPEEVKKVKIQVQVKVVLLLVTK